MLAAGAGSRSISLLIAPRYACADHDNDHDNDAADGEQITTRSHYLLGGGTCADATTMSVEEPEPV